VQNIYDTEPPSVMQFNKNRTMERGHCIWQFRSGSLCNKSLPI